MAFEKGKPEPGIKAKFLDDRVRDNNDFIQPALDNDHDFTDSVGANQTGKHKTLHMLEQSSPGASTTGEGNFAVVDSGTQPELEFTSEDGNAKIITDEGKINNVFADMGNVAIDEDDMASDSDVHFPTQQSVKSYADSASVPSGAMVFWGSSSAPTGWLLCQGQAISRTTYDGIFSVYGTTFGTGDGSTTFNLPDWLGRIPVGVGTGDAADATAHTLGQKQGTETHLNTADESGLVAHNHTYIKATTSANTGSIVGSGSNGTVASSTAGPSDAVSAHNNLQPSLGIYYIIKT